jgi:hypothetical protein
MCLNLKLISVETEPTLTCLLFLSLLDSKDKTSVMSTLWKKSL